MFRKYVHPAFPLAAVAACLAAAAPAARADVITGKVVGPDGAPVAGATVYVEHEVGGPVVATLKTGADGTFATPDLALIKLPANPYGSGPQTCYGVAAVDAPGFALKGKVLQKDAEANVIPLAKAVSLHGIVVDEAGKPLAGVAVMGRFFENDPAAGRDIYRAQGGNATLFPALQEQMRTKSAADGTFTVGRLPATGGKAAAWLVDPRFISVAADIPLQAADSAPGAVRLVARAAASLTGRVLYEATGKPAAGVRVTAEAGDFGIAAAAVTGADGAYVLSGLRSGTHAIAVSDTRDAAGARAELAAAAKTGIVAEEGKSAAVPDLSLVPAAAIRVTVTDSGTGKPVSGVQIRLTGPTHPAAAHLWSGVQTDDSGTATLHVLPGKNAVAIGGLPAGYLWDSDTGREQAFDVQKGDSLAAAFTVTRGLTVSGTVAGVDGKPVAGVHVRLVGAGRYDADYDYSGQDRPASDDAGKWTLSGLRKNGDGYRVAVDPKWVVMQPSQPFQIPLPDGAAPLAVVVKPADGLRDLHGRVVTPAGEPAPGVQVAISAQIPASDGRTSSQRYANVTTDASGAYVFPDVRPAETVTVSISQANGYAYRSGGAVTKTDSALAVTDLVLARLNGTVTGRVLDAGGKPVAGAQVWSLDGGDEAHTVTDPAGAFTLTGVPVGPVSVTAAIGRKVATAQGAAVAAGTSAGPALKLTPEALAAGPADPAADWERAKAILSGVAGKMRAAGGNVPRSGIPDIAARLDPDLALEYAKGLDGVVVEGVRAALIELLTARDPKRAATWGVQQLAEIQTPMVRCRIEGELGLTLAPANPALAAQLYAGALHDGENGNAVDINRARLLALSIALKNGDAPKHLALLQEALSQAAHKGYASRCAAIVARVDPPTAETLLAGASTGAKAAFYDGQVRTVVKTSPLQAQRYLQRLRDALKEDKGDRYYEEYVLPGTTELVVRALGPTDPAAALAEARRLTGGGKKAWALAVAASFQSKAGAPAIWKEALAEVGGDRETALLARMAALAGDSQSEIAHSLRQRVIAAIRRDDADFQNDAPEIAYYVAAFDPALARSVAERTWNRYRSQPPGSRSDYQMAQAALALVPVDLDRAAALLTGGDPSDAASGVSYAYYQTVRLARLLELPPAARKTISFEALENGDMDDLQP